MGRFFIHERSATQSTLAWVLHPSGPSLSLSLGLRNGTSWLIDFKRIQGFRTTSSFPNPSVLVSQEQRAKALKKDCLVQRSLSLASDTHPNRRKPDYKTARGVKVRIIGEHTWYCAPFPFLSLSLLCRVLRERTKITNSNSHHPETKDAGCY